MHFHNIFFLGYGSFCVNGLSYQYSRTCYYFGGYTEIALSLPSVLGFRFNLHAIWQCSIVPHGLYGMVFLVSRSPSAIWYFSCYRVLPTQTVQRSPSPGLPIV